MQYTFSAIVEHDEDGYWARCPDLQGCYAQGRTYDEALDNLREAVALHLDDRQTLGVDIAAAETITLIPTESPR